MNKKSVFATVAMMLSVSCFAAMPTGGICAHRGDRAAYPENTVPAFKAAVEKGAAMVEFDVHRCKTGELIVMHDNTIDRTTTGKGRWCELTFDYLRSVDAGIKHGSQFAGVRIPTFDEAIDCFPMDGVWLNVHCDALVTDEVARKIKAKGRLHQAFIATNLEGVNRARQAVPEIKTCLFALPKDSWHHAWTAEERRQSIEAVMAAKAEFTQPHYADFTQDELYAYHAAGGKVNYFWCNKPERLAGLIARGIDFPLTDNLEPMVKAYRELVESPWTPPDPESKFKYACDSRRDAVKVTIATSLGDIALELDAAKAPLTVSNFVAYAKSGHYAGTVFHRVINGFMIQGGGFTPDMTQKATLPPIRNEAANGLKNLRGTIAMARTMVVDSATSQFFINLKDNGFLDHTAPNPRQFGYAVFGRVTKGMDIVDKIAQVKTGNVGYYQDVPVEPVVIKSVKVAE